MKNQYTPETKEEFVMLLDTYNVYVERTLVVLFESQTTSEQIHQATTESNGVGFTGLDGHILSSLAQQVIDKAAKGVPAGRRLSESQLTKICRKRDAKGNHKLGKYWKQIQRAIELKENRKTVAVGSSEEFQIVAL